MMHTPNAHPTGWCIDAFLETLAAERGAALNTIQAYARDLNNFIVSCAVSDPQNVTHDEVTAYLKRLAADGIKASTRARHLSALRQYFRFLLSENVVNIDPTHTIVTPKLGRQLPKVLSEEEVGKLFAALNEKKTPNRVRLLALLEVTYASGMRVSELLNLPLSSYQDKDVLMIKGKGGKDRLVPLNESAKVAIKAYLDIRHHFLTENEKNPWLFPSRGKEGHLTRQRYGQLLKELALEAGIDLSKISPHVVRHAFATHLLNHGADLATLQKILGHSDIATTQIYTHVATDRLKNVVNTCHPLSKLSKG
jgi:integrase/recombinase XerD